MGINFANEKVNVKSTQQFGSKCNIRNPVQEEIKRIGLKTSKLENERMFVENYMTKEEYKAFVAMSPSQQKRAFEVFKQSPEYKKFKKYLNQYENNSQRWKQKIYVDQSQNVAYNGTSNYSKISERESSYVAMEKEKKACEEAIKEFSESGVETAAQTGAAAGSSGASQVTKEAIEAVKKYAETLKEASSEHDAEPSDYETEHSSDSAITKSDMSIIQKITAVIIALAAALLSQIGVFILPIIIVITIVIVLTTLIVTVISSIAAVFTSTAQVASGLYRQLLSDNTVSYIQDVAEYAKTENVEDYINYLMAIMEVESHGSGIDVMQSSESAGLSPNTFKTPQESILQGTKYFASCISKANEKGCDVNTAVQAYNYGTGFIDYVSENGKVYTLDLAINYAKEKSGEKQVEYKNQIAIDYNGGWRYAYGNMFYVQLVNQYIYHYENATVQKIIDEAMKYSGWDYISGGCRPDDGGFDCSGLVQYVYGQAGIDLPRLEKDQYAACDEIKAENMQPGDLIFYKNETSNGDIGHVAIYLGNGKVFEAGEPIGIYNATDEWHKNNQIHVGRPKGFENILDESKE